MMATKSFYEINKIIDPNLYFERLREIMMKNNQLSVQIWPKCPNDRKVMKELHYMWKSKEIQSTFWSELDVRVVTETRWRNFDPYLLGTDPSVDVEKNASKIADRKLRRLIVGESAWA